MRNLMMSLLVITVLFSVGLSAEAVDVSGTWEFTMQSPRGERTSEMTIVQDGDAITVTMEGFRGEEMTGEGTVEGNKVQWKVTFESPRGEMTLVYTGTVDGDSMSGQMEMEGGEREPMEWSAKKMS